MNLIKKLWNFLKKLITCGGSTENNMPQPLSSFSSPGTIIFGNVGDYPLQRHPDLALLAAEVINSWSNVESFHLNLFITLLGGHGEKAADIYLALEARSAKSSAIRVIADSLPQAHKNLMHAILRLSKSLQGKRDSIAHGMWGDCTGIPNALLLVSPKDNINHFGDYSKIFVYRENEFNQIIRDNERLAGYGQKLNHIISGHASNRDDELLDELSAVPEIRDILDRLASQD